MHQSQTVLQTKCLDFPLIQLHDSSMLTVPYSHTTELKWLFSGPVPPQSANLTPYTTASSSNPTPNLLAHPAYPGCFFEGRFFSAQRLFVGKLAVLRWP